MDEPQPSPYLSLTDLLDEVGRGHLRALDRVSAAEEPGSKTITVTLDDGTVVTAKLGAQGARTIATMTIGGETFRPPWKAQRELRRAFNAAFPTIWRRQQDQKETERRITLHRVAEQLDELRGQLDDEAPRTESDDGRP